MRILELNVCTEQKTLAKALYTNGLNLNRTASNKDITAINCIFQPTSTIPMTLSDNDVDDVLLGSHLDLVEFELEAEQLGEHG